MKYLDVFKEMDKKDFYDMILKWAIKKQSWYNKGIICSIKELKQLRLIEKITNLIHPEFDYLFKKKTKAW